MKIKQNDIIQIFQNSEMHLFIIILSLVSAVFFLVLALILKKNSISEKVKKIINYVIYIIGTIAILMMFFNPSIWFQCIFINKNGTFYKDTLDIIIFISNLLTGIILPYSCIARNKAYKFFSFYSFFIILIQIINPSSFFFYSEIPNHLFNNISLAGYVIYLIVYFGLSVYNITNVVFYKQAIRDCKNVLFSLVLLIPIIFPYIIFSRFEMFVPKDISNTIDLNSFQKGLVIIPFTFSHLCLLFVNIFIFLIYYYTIKYVFKKEFIYDLLILLLTGVIFTVVCRRATYLFENNIGFYLLPDSPCAIGSFVAYFALLFKNKLLTTYSVFITFSFTTLNNLLMFQGGMNNFWNYLTMDSMFYHLYLSIIIFNMIKLDFFVLSKKLIFKSCVLFSIIYFTFVFLGNLQTRIEFLTGQDLCSNKFVGFFYNSPAFNFLDDIVYSFCFVGEGFEILPINWILSLGAACTLAYLSYFVYYLFSYTYKQNINKLKY